VPGLFFDFSESILIAAWDLCVKFTNNPIRGSPSDTPAVKGFDCATMISNIYIIDVLAFAIDNNVFGPIVERYQLSQGVILEGDDRRPCLVVEGCKF